MGKYWEDLMKNRGDQSAQLRVAQDEVNVLKIKNKRQLDQIADYEAQLAAYRAENEPVICESWTMTYSELVAALSAKGLELMRKDKFVPDRLIQSTDALGWKRIVPHLVLPADLYVEDVADCDDYAEFAKARAAMIYKRSGCRYCWGDTSDGPHGFGLVMVSPTEFMLFEPNAGFEFAGVLFRDGEHGYVGRSWE